MKKIAAFIFLISLISCSKKNKEETSFKAEALSQTLLNTEGNQVSFSSILEENKGKTTVIEIWASWCGDCIQAMPKIKKLQLAHPEINFVFISVDNSVSAWQNGIIKHELRGSQFMANDQMDGKFANAIDLESIGRYIIIDKKGKIILYQANDTDFDLIEKTITELK